MTQVSIIVPVYNSENTLERCISSLLNQTYKDYELLIINDGSTDRSAEICDSYATKDDRIKVFHKQNGGVSSARNQGLDNVSGKWVTFVDSDDWVDELYIETLVESSSCVDLVLGYATLVNYPNRQQVCRQEMVIKSDEYYKLFSECDLGVRTAPWNKLFKFQIIHDNDIRFPLGVPIGEDAVFLYTFLLYSENVNSINSRHYYYLYDSENSLTKKNNSLELERLALHSIESAIRSLIHRRNIVNSIALNELYGLQSRYIHRVLNAIYYSSINKEERIELISKLDVSLYCSYFLRMHKSRYFNILRYCLLKKRYSMYDLIRRVVKLIKYRNVIK